MDRDSFFNRPKKTKTFTVEGFGDVTICKLTAVDVAYMKKHYSDESKGIDGCCFMMIKAVVDAEGNRLFKDDEREQLAAKLDYDVLETIALEIAQFGGLKQAGPKAESVV